MPLFLGLTDRERERETPLLEEFFCQLLFAQFLRRNQPQALPGPNPLNETTSGCICATLHGDVPVRRGQILRYASTQAGSRDLP